MRTAEQLRKEIEAKKTGDARNAVLRLKNSLERAVDQAVSNLSLQATVEVPEELDETPLHLIKEGYEKLGYRVKFSMEQGTLGTNLVRFPKKYITLYW